MRISPYALLTLANLFWAGNWIIGRGMRGDVPPLALSFWRWAIALALILPLAWPHLRRDWPQLRAGWPWLILCGLLGTACYNTLAYIALQHTTAINGLLLNSFIPIAIVCLGWIVLGKKLRLVEALGIGASFLGVLTIVARGDAATLAALQFNPGDIWILVSVLVWAVYTLALPHRPAADALSFLAAITVVGLIALTPFYAWELSEGRQINPTPSALAAIAYTGVFPAFLGFLFWNRGVAETDPARAGLFIHLLPAFGIILSMIFLDEHPAPFHFVGIGLILSGIWLNTQRQS